MDLTCYWKLEVSVGATKAAEKGVIGAGTLASDPDNWREMIPVAQMKHFSTRLRKTHHDTVAPNFPLQV